MAFKIPLPIAGKKPQPLPKLQPGEYDKLQLPEFRKNDFRDLILIGQGAFGNVYRASKDESVFVIKELTNAAASATERRHFVKEAAMLKTLQDHEHVVAIRGFSVKDCAILMDYVFSITQNLASSMNTFPV